MDRLTALLAEYGLDADNPDYSTLTDEQLAAFHEAALALYDELRAEDEVDIAALRTIAETVEALGTVDQERQTQAEADARELAEIDERIRPAASDTDDDADEGDGEEGAEGEGDGGEAEGAVETPAVEPVPEPVLASAGPAQPRRVPLAALAARRATAHAPAPADDADRSGYVITAGADIPGVSAGQPLDDMDDVVDAFIARLDSVSGSRLSPGMRFQVARFARPVVPERQFSDSDYAYNERLLANIVASAQAGFHAAGDAGFEALVAAGGLCAPLPASYAQETLGTTARPILDGLPGGDAGARGGLRFMPGPVITDIDTTGSDAAIRNWTMDDDENAAVDAAVRKPIMRVTCGTETTVEIEAWVMRLLIGNMLGRTFPERIRAFIRLVMVEQVRLAENRLAAKIKAASVQTAEETQTLGSRRDLLAQILKAAWATRNRYRMGDDEVLQVLLPDAAFPHFQIDRLRQLPGDGGGLLTRAEAVAELRAAGVDPIISPDMPGHMAATTQVAGAQLTDLPSPIEWAIFPMGTFATVTMPAFDLGFESGTEIRDTTRNAANDYEIFGETFENIYKPAGWQSIWNRSFVCPTGEVAGTVDVSCDTAS